MRRSTLAYLCAELQSAPGRREMLRATGAAIQVCFGVIVLCLWAIALWGRGC